MCANKTGGLARMAAKMSAIVCGATEQQIEAFGSFAESIGVAFQIQDDILNLQDEGTLAASKGGIGEDIHEGKRTLMVLHCFEHGTAEEVKRLKEILSMKTNDKTLIVEAISILRKNKSIEYAAKVAKELISTAWAKVDGLLENSLAKRKLKALVDFLVSRDM